MIECCGFSNELRCLYGGGAAERFVLDAFEWMPIAACIGKSALCVHGGIGPAVTSLPQITGLRRPLRNYDENEIVESLLWSDPVDAICDFQPSSRGLGYQFGADAAVKFLDAIGFDCIIRGHEVAEEGIKTKFGGRVLTVFGASNYCGRSGNCAAVLTIKPDGAHDLCVLPPMPYIKREAVEFATLALPTPQTENMPVVRVSPLIPKLPRCEIRVKKLSPTHPTGGHRVMLNLPTALSVRRRVFSPVPRL
jgi:protein phosphatase